MSPAEPPTPDFEQQPPVQRPRNNPAPGRSPIDLPAFDSNLELDGLVPSARGVPEGCIRHNPPEGGQGFLLRSGNGPAALAFGEHMAMLAYNAPPGGRIRGDLQPFSDRYDMAFRTRKERPLLQESEEPMFTDDSSVLESLEAIHSTINGMFPRLQPRPAPAAPESHSVVKEEPRTRTMLIGGSAAGKRKRDLEGLQGPSEQTDGQPETKVPKMEEDQVDNLRSHSPDSRPPLRQPESMPQPKQENRDAPTGSERHAEVLNPPRTRTRPQSDQSHGDSLHESRRSRKRSKRSRDRRNRRKGSYHGDRQSNYGIDGNAESSYYHDDRHLSYDADGSTEPDYYQQGYHHYHHGQGNYRDDHWGHDSYL